VKVGDLVQILPARISHYIIVDRCVDQQYGTPQWILYSLDDTGGITMSESWIEVISESR